MTKKNENINFQIKLYGLNKYFIDLVKLIEIGRLPKVLMLTGKKGQGKFTLTHHLLSYFFDKKHYDLKQSIILENNKIFLNIKENTNPNIIYYKCADKNVKIEDIRKLRTNLQKSSMNNLNRFIIFDDVEGLNENCVNALLKTIEEPSETNYFLLINNKNNTILNTLKSRSIEVLFFLSIEQKIDIIQNLLKDFNIEQIIDLNKSTLTPGNYLRYNQILSVEKIDMKDKLIVNLDKLLKLNKTKKNVDYLNIAIYLINQFYFNKSKNSSNINNYNDKRTNIIKKVNEFNKLNLNNMNLITEIENYI